MRSLGYVLVATVFLAPCLASTSAAARGPSGDVEYGPGPSVFPGQVYGRVGLGRAAFYIPGAIPAGTPYDPYRLPFSYGWPYGYGFNGH